MKTYSFVIAGALAVGSALLWADASPAQMRTTRTATYLGGTIPINIPQGRSVYLDVNCSPNRSFFLVNPGSVPPLVPPPAPGRQPTAMNRPFYPPVYPRYPVYQPIPVYQPYPIYQPFPVYTQPNAVSQIAQQSSRPSAIVSSLRPNAAPAPEKPAEPTEPAVRLRNLEFTVSGADDTSARGIITASLEKMKGVKGASVKKNASGAAVVKVWYSEKEPVEAIVIIQAVDNLGFKAVQTGS